MGSGRRTIAAAVATVLTAIGLYPVYSGTAWWWAGVGAAASVAGAGTLTRRRRLPVPVCLLSGLAGLLLYLNLVFAHGRSLGAVLPTPSSLGYLANLAGQGIGEASRYAPPVPELTGMVLLAAGGIGLTALLTDLIAVRLGSAALAGLPLLLLFAEPFTLSISRGTAGSVMVFCLAVTGYLTLLATEGGERIRSWEQPEPGASDGSSADGVSGVRPPDTSALAAAGRRVGAVSVVVALFVPLFVPGLHVTRLFGGGQPGIGGSGGAGGVLGFPDPQSQISGELRSKQAAPVLSYTSTSGSPGYLQVYVLGDLTARGWQFSHRPQSLVPGDGPALTPPGLASGNAATRVSTQISISGQTGPDVLGALPAPYPPTRVTAPGTVQADPATLMLFDHGAQLPGVRYSVTSLDVTPTPQALAAAPPPPKNITSEYLNVPQSYTSLRALAKSIAQTATTPFAKAVDLQDWFADGNFGYSLSAPALTNAASLVNFIDNTHTGYCQQFAFAMAVLARLDGIPSRIAYGFTQGTHQRDGGWLVTTHDAHAWPELYFAGYGWLRFEPTPDGTGGQGTATTPGYATPQSGPLSPGQATPAPSATNTAGTSAGNANSQSALHGHQFPGESGFGGTALPVQSPAGPNPWELAGLAVAGLLIVMAAAPGLARSAIRRRRWRRARRLGGNDPSHTPRRDGALADAAWRELRDDLTDYRADCPASESPRALARRVTEELELSGEASEALRRVTMAAERARYSARPASGATLRRDSATVRHAIAASLPRRKRWLARVFPASVMSPAMAAPGRIAALASGDVSGKKDRLTRRRVRLSHDASAEGGASAQDGRDPAAVRS